MKKKEEIKVEETTEVNNTTLDNDRLTSSLESNSKRVPVRKKQQGIKIKKLSSRQVGNQVINLEDIEKLNIEDQRKYFEQIFEQIYSGEEIEDLRKYALRCIKLTCDPKDNKIHLPYGVVVEKKKHKLYIRISKTKNVFLILLLVTLLFLAILGSSYSAISYSIMKNLNKDVDGDGVADINLDINNDKQADINIDINNDNIPDVNIDYNGNRKPIFNIDTNNSGNADMNFINQDLNNDGVCDLNCDLNDDGWPDINIDIDGDGKLDLFKDKDNDRKADLNFDMDGDGVCDLHCDTTGDDECDKYCLTSEEVENVIPINSGTSQNVGNNKQTLNSGELILEYDDDNMVFITDIYPDDQPYFEQEIPIKKFRVANKSSLYVLYNLRWVVVLNDYESDNFKYRISSTLNGVTFDWKTAPKTTGPLATEIIIPPFSVHEYTVEFKLQGVGGNQDYDQGKTFSGFVEIYLDNEM